MPSEKDQDAVLDFLRQQEDASVAEMIAALGIRDEKSVRNAIDALRYGHLRVNIRRVGYNRFGLRPGKWRGRDG